MNHLARGSLKRGIDASFVHRAIAVAALWFVATCAAATPEPAVLIDVSVTIDPVARTLLGVGTLQVAPGDGVSIVLDERFQAVEMRWGDQVLALSPGRTGAWELPAAAASRTVTVRWVGTLDALDTTLDHRQTLGALAPVTGSAGTFLPGAANWYPHIDGALARHRVTIRLPPGQRGLVPGRLLDERDDDRGYRASFDFAFPAEAVDLIAGPYAISERRLALADGHEVRLRTYFAAGLEDLAAGYLASTEAYLRMYDDRIGPYPFSEFSIVSSPTPTGFGMPTLTYLGANVLRLPFIRATSLGHEVLHNWWGNGVYPDYARGNWSEGLTTFMADYQYKLRESEAAARDLRLAWLRDFAAVPPGQDAPLSEFTSRTHGTSQIVGYDKAAMLFVMLRDLIGAAAFDQGIRAFWAARRFTVASWDDLRTTFEQASARDLEWFFVQWTRRSGAPHLRIERAERAAIGDRWQVRMTIAQDTPAYRLRIPVAIDTDRGTVERIIELDAPSLTVAFELADRPRAIRTDPDLRLFRRLDTDEAPPILRDVLVNSGTRAIVLADAAPFVDATRALLEKLLDQPPHLEHADAVPDGAPLIVVGTAAEVAQFRSKHGIGPPPALPGTVGTAIVWTERFGSATIVFVSARDAAAVAALGRPLPHYGRQSWLVFDGGKAVERGTWPPEPHGWVFE
ncbi:MAG: M1 family aminopeptidase [Betaproteobacteria bacterium]